MSFFEELRRRNVFRVGVAYLAAVWVLIQVADVVLPNLGAPPWIIQVLIFSCALGFPVVLVLAWFYEWTADGIKAEVEAEAAQTVKGRGLDFAIIGLLVLAVGFLVVDNYLLERQVDLLPNSVAVLPFDNLSPNPSDAYFAAGIHEEILNQLARVSAVNVIARTSVLPYADDRPSIRQIADELRVGTVMEGSVRYADNRVRITAQLIDPGSGTHLWSDTYERDFDDIFAIESDIAMNIANALEAEFSVVEQQQIESIPTVSPAAYALYLRSLREGYTEALGFLDRAIALDPEFGLAHAAKAMASMFYYYTGPGAGSPPERAVEIEQIIRTSAEAALAADPTIGLAHAALGALHQFNWRGADAERSFKRAIELNPNNVPVLMLYGRFKRYVGDHEESVRLIRRAIELDPNNAFSFGQLALTLKSGADWDQATEACRRFLAENPLAAGCHLMIAEAEALRGNSAEVAATLEIVEQTEPTPLRLAQAAYAYSLAGRADDARRLFSALEVIAREESVGEATWALANLAIGENERALQHLERAETQRVSTDFVILSGMIANPWGDPRLANPPFRTVLDEFWGIGQ